MGCATLLGANGLNPRDEDHNHDADAILMQRFCAGNEEAFVKLYERYRNRMVSFAKRLLGDQATAEEAAQDVFLKLYKTRDRYRVESRFSTFLYRIATNHCLNIKARHEHKLTDRYAVADQSARSEADQTTAVEKGELRSALTAALTTLPENQRAALVLCHYEGMSYGEAAKVIDVSVSAIKSLIHRARDRMMQELAPYMNTAEAHDAV